MNDSAPDLVGMCVTGDVWALDVTPDQSVYKHCYFFYLFFVVFIVSTHICVLVSSDGDELRLREDEGLSLGREEGVLRAVLLHLHHVQARLVLVQRLEDDHLRRRHTERGSRPLEIVQGI